MPVHSDLDLDIYHCTLLRMEFEKKINMGEMEF